MLYLKLVPDTFKNASRDKRELSVARELGYEVRVIDRTLESKDYSEKYEGYDVYHISTRRLGNVEWLHFPNRLIAFMSYVLKTLEMDAEIVSGHDYIALLAAYIANCFKRKKAKLIYDSHEFELYRYAPNRTDFQRKIIKLIEGFLIRRVNLSLMVGDRIADGVQETYNLKKRPTVVRNIPAYWHLAPKKSEKIRNQFLERLRLFDKAFLLMYHGGITQGRGIECAIQALHDLPETVGMVVMGDEGHPGMIERLQKQAEKEAVLHRILFHPAVPMAELKNYVSSVDAELVLQSSQIDGMQCVNILYSLPNKFFESIQARIPVICCDLPEMERLVKKYDIGLVVKENDAKAVADAVLKLREDKELYAKLKRNMEKAKDELCWEKERLKLKRAIQEMMGESRDAV